MSKLDIPDELHYSETHEWIRVEGDNQVVVGITQYAASQLGEIVLVDLPELGSIVHATDEIASIESIKTTSEVYSPISGKVVAVNEDLEESPKQVNDNPYHDGWLFVLAPKDPEEYEHLMDAKRYAEYLEGDEE